MNSGDIPCTIGLKHRPYMALYIYGIGTSSESVPSTSTAPADFCRFFFLPFALDSQQHSTYSLFSAL